MADTPNPDWMNQWQALARQYAHNWQSAAQGAKATPEPRAAIPGFEQWSQLLTPPAGSQSDTIERLVDSTKSYAAYMQSLFAMPSAHAQGGNPSWANAFAPGLANADASAPFAQSTARAWRDMAVQGGPDFTTFASALRPPAAADLGELKAWMKLPAFGSSREQQEHYQNTAVAAVEYQEQMNRYNALMMKASQRGFELFESKLAEREQPGRQIESLRALYDLWVDAAEEGYAEVALSAEFREVYAALVNAQMRVRSLVQREVERIGGELGMPTRSEVNSMGERLQALRREVRARGNDVLAGELSALREEFAAFKGNLKRAQDGADMVERAPAKVPRKALATRKRVAKSKSASAKNIASVAKVDSPKKKATRPAASANARRPTTAKKSVRRASVEASKPDAKAPAAGSRNFASRIAKFADASLGSSRTRTRKPAQVTKSRSVKAR